MMDTAVYITKKQGTGRRVYFPSVSDENHLGVCFDNIMS